MNTFLVISGSSFSDISYISFEYDEKKCMSNIFSNDEINRLLFSFSFLNKN